MYKMVDISAEVWNKAEVSVIRVHENEKTLLWRAGNFYYKDAHLRKRKIGRNWQVDDTK